MEVSRFCEEKEINNYQSQLEARKLKRQELMEKFAKERHKRNREKELKKLSEGRGKWFKGVETRKSNKEKKKNSKKIEDAKNNEGSSGALKMEQECCLENVKEKVVKMISVVKAEIKKEEV